MQLKAQIVIATPSFLIWRFGQGLPLPILVDGTEHL